MLLTRCFNEADNHMFSVTANISITQVKPTCSIYQYLQGECQANEVDHHLFVGQLHAEETQQSKEGLIVPPAAALLLAAQVDVSVELLSVLWGVGGGCTRRTLFLS